MAETARQKGIRGFIIDGSIRDCDAFAAMDDFACYACAVTPNGPYKNGPGEIGVPIAVGHQVIFPGDIIVGDQDSVVVIRPDDAREVATKAREVFEAEARKLIAYREGNCNRSWLNKALDELDYEII